MAGIHQSMTQTIHIFVRVSVLYMYMCTLLEVHATMRTMFAAVVVLLVV
jgi:hypothetical protein